MTFEWSARTHHEPSDLRFESGAGDGNRTRTISLGIGQIMADEDAAQPTSKTRSSRD
jgi:hypothetical protein